MSRPKGSKNKVKRNKMSEVADEQKVKETANQNVLHTETKASTVNVAIDEDADKVDSFGGDCQNCVNHGKDSSELNKDGTCPVCGFDKSKLYGAY